MKLSRRAALGGLLLSAAAAPSRADDWRPSRSMSWIVPFPPGGSNDIFARPVAARVGQSLGQAVVVDNRAGAGGTLGGMIAARAAPDGCTLLVGNTGLTFARIVYDEGGFDLARDFAPVSLLASVPVALVVNPTTVPVMDLVSFLALARAAPGRMTVGSSGLGTIPHLAIELLQQRAGIRLTHVPYRGGGQALQDVVSGTIDALVTPLSTVVSYVQSGRLRALAVASTGRQRILPEVPTFAEAGLADFRVSSWYGLFAPKATPVVAVDTLHAAVQAALASADVERIWAEQGARVDLVSRLAFTAFVESETERWSALAKTIGIPKD
ncbi:MAG: Bug family tripartite tricarboxylate transporter substrate binding protein [Reyranella sp.]|uniref:Bug family tripartite tricarboxylate transporter substrate binding protein n=1 Tax=Reyranella sp. TaxID=1929291 RepID=UPI003D10C1B8